MRMKSAGLVLTLVAGIPLILSAQQQLPASIFKGQSDLVLVPAVVTDKAGNPITGLRSKDFVLLHNGKAETLGVFEEITGAPGRPQREPLGPGLAQNYAFASNRVDIHILLLDLFGADVWTKESIQKKLLPIAQQFADRQIPLSVLVFSYNGLTQVHSLADDPADFVTAVKLWASDHPHKLKSGDPTPQWASIFEKTTPQETAEALRRYAFYIPDSPRKGILDPGNDFDEFRMRVRAMTQLVEAFRGLPQRKRLIWYGAAPSSVWFPDPNFDVYPILVLHLATSRLSGQPYFTHGGTKLFCNTPIDRYSYTVQYPSGTDLCTDKPDVCVQRMLAEGYHHYILGFYLRGNPDPGLHSLSVRVVGTKSNVRTRDSFSVDLPSGLDVKQATKIREKALDAAYRKTQTPTFWDFVDAIKPVQEVDQQERLIEALASPLDYTSMPLRVEWSQDNDSSWTLKLASPPEPQVGEVFRIIVVIYVRNEVTGQEQFFQEKLEKVLSPNDQKEFSEVGFHLNRRIQLPPGVYGVRVLVRDMEHSRMGTVSLHLQSKRLPQSASQGSE